MRLRACVLATAAALVAAPTVAGARAERSRPPGPAWAPGAAAAALGRVVARSADVLPALQDLCAPRPFGLSLPLPLRSTAPTPDGRCELANAPGWSLVSWRPASFDAAAVFLGLELRDLAAGPIGLLARFLPEPAALELQPDLTALTTSPVPGIESSGFGWRRDPIHHRAKFHKGTDFRARHGTPVYAAGPGRVVWTGQQNGYGNIIYLDHGGGLVTRYAHLQRFEIERGELVSEGRLIGRVGSTGRATGPHLHFEVRVGDRAVEPALALRIGLLQRTDPEAARAAALELRAEVQDTRVDSHSPPRRARKVDRRDRPRGGRPERAGVARRVRPVS
jgi:murein DD-endopeptidase MepM/ murein hydrolase activator NlpD